MSETQKNFVSRIIIDRKPNMRYHKINYVERIKTMKTLFNDNWFFTKYTSDTPIEEILAAPLKTASVSVNCPEKNSGLFSAIDIPHDWMIYNTSDLYETCIGVYAKTFTVSTVSGKRYSLLFDGVYMDSEVFVNGKKAGEWKYGYTSFIFDITGLLINGTNEVRAVVRYNNPNTRFYSGAGIYRDVFFVETDSVHFLHNGVYITARPKNGGFPTSDNPGDWTVSIRSEIRNELSETCTDCTLKHEIFDASGASVACISEEITVKPSASADYAAAGCHPSDFADIFSDLQNVSSPTLWDINNPYLYTVKSTLIRNGQLCDSIENPLGFRTVLMDPDRGFFLNNRHFKLNGVCMHHDLGALGSAFNVNAALRQFESMKAMGVNAIRTSHNPAAEKYIELADRFGMLIDSEFTDMWTRKKTEFDYGCFFEEWAERDVASWVRRDRNHPCVIMWSIGNEIGDTNFDYSVDITRNLISYVRVNDPEKHALTTIGSNYMENEWANKCADLLDVAGYNYFEKLYDEHHKKYPKRVIYGSETSSTVQSRGVYHFPYTNRLLTHMDEQCSTLGNCTTNWGARDTAAVIAMDRDAAFSLGQFVWSGWDYIGEPTPYFNKNSYFGQVDTAGFEKDTYFQYKAEWTDVNTAPFVHLLPCWDFNAGQLIDVRMYSNADTVELFFSDFDTCRLAGKGAGTGEYSDYINADVSSMTSLGKFNIDHKNGKTLAAGLTVPYKPGVLCAVAYNSEGKEIARDICSSFGDTAKLLLIPNKYELKADGEDLIFVELRAIDENGVFVANARDRAEVSVSGAARLVGLDNGDSTDYDEYKGTCRRLFNGRLLAIIAAGKEAGTATLEVEAPGLPKETLEFKVAGLSATEAEQKETAHISCNTRNTRSPENKEICVRKIELTCNGPSVLTKESPETTVSARILPESATYRELSYKAMISSGIEANFISLEPIDGGVKIKATGDGAFRLCCYSTNGRNHPEVISELEFSAEGIGHAGLNPYELVCSCMSTPSDSVPLRLSFKGGILTPNTKHATTFDNVEFGDYGSDEITIPIFHWFEKIPLEIWDGVPGAGGELLLACTYEHESLYNRYMTNTFKLPKRLRGTRSISIVTFESISLQGFYFTRLNKAFSSVPAVECTRVSGDSYKKTPEAVTGIGNNVSIEFDNMDFGPDGAGKITILGRTPNTENPISLFFEDENGTDRQSVTFSGSDVYVEQTFEIRRVTGRKKVILVFLPGSNFDLKSIQFRA